VFSSGYMAHFGEGNTSAGIDFKNRLAALPTTGTVATIAWMDSTSGFSSGSLLLGSRPSVGGVILSANGGVNLFISPTNGNVGIGTSNPIVKTEFSGPESMVSIRVNTENGGVGPSNYSEIQLADNSTVRAFWRNCRDGSGATKFGYNEYLALLSSAGSGGVERVRFHNNGNVSVGSTVNAGFKLDVKGSFCSQGAVTFAGAFQNKMRIITGGSGTYTVNADDYTIIMDFSVGSTMTLPDPATTTVGRNLRFVNRTGGSISSGRAFFDLTKAAISQFPTGKSFELQNDGSVWHQVA
jgi:hypothetical protein